MAPLDIKEIPPQSTIYILPAAQFGNSQKHRTTKRTENIFCNLFWSKCIHTHRPYIFLEFYLPFQENQGWKLEKTGRCDSPRSFAALRNKIAAFCRLATFSSVISIVITIILICTKTWVTADSVSHFLFLEDRLHERKLLQMPIALSSTKCTMCLCWNIKYKSHFCSILQKQWQNETLWMVVMKTTWWWPWCWWPLSGTDQELDDQDDVGKDDNDQD